ncbi:MAG: hypothetical protein K6B74_07425 [Ruminococcus sp.]|nr:hypothetical protein [Ruminococcus sp.]
MKCSGCGNDIFVNAAVCPCCGTINGVHCRSFGHAADFAEAALRSHDTI